MQGLKLWLVVTAVIIVIAGLGIFLAQKSDRGSQTESPGTSKIPPEIPRPAIERTYAGSARCRKCHEANHAAWEGSHHALAERDFTPALDRHAFVPTRKIRHGTLNSEAREEAGALEIVTLGADDNVQPYRPIRVIGVAPLYQFVIPASAGRYQVCALTFDPAKREWFDVFGEEDRRPHEWGYWTSRGMNWNAMCAGCHMTRLRKGYDIATDSYSTTWTEVGVGCEGCHGPYQEHVAWYESDAKDTPWPDRPTRTPDTVFDTCGSCHARRVELTAGFVPGEPFFDHYRPVLPDDPAIYYADGQVREEDYEFISFLSSRMYTEGVRCINCHEPHSAKVRLEGNALCLSCHKGKIDPASHSRHDVNGPGGQCANCHMPLTTYMQRHPRRDHGFTIPDPLLTKELGIPNACNRCHTDKPVDWAIEAADKWYGARLERATRKRARTVARAREGDPAAINDLIAMVKQEKAPVWRGVAVALLRQWIDVEAIRARFVEWLGDPEPLVRAAAVRAFDVLPDGARQVRHLTGDVSRLVRIESAWTQRRTLDEDSPAGKELNAYLDQIADQPTGALQRAMFYLDRNDVERAQTWAEKAVNWDGNSPPLRHALAVVLSTLGRTPEAIDQLKAAERLEPDSAEHAHSLGLAYAEVGKLQEAIKSLQRACDLEPQFARAWYNLGLAYVQTDDALQGISAIERAEREDATNPEYPYARATVHMQRGERAAAREAVLRALEIAPNFPAARALLQALEAAK